MKLRWKEHEYYRGRLMEEFRHINIPLIDKIKERIEWKFERTCEYIV